MDILKNNANLGGTVRISYNDFEVMAPYDHLLDVYGCLSANKNRRGIIVSVEKSIKNTIKKHEKGRASNKELCNLAQDICIWFANEIIDRRKSFQDVSRVDI